MKLNKSVLYIALFCYLFIFAALPMRESISHVRGDTVLLLLIEAIPGVSDVVSDFFSFRTLSPYL